MLVLSGWINLLRPKQNGRLFADYTFKRIFLNENIRILIKISLTFAPKGLINNIPALVLIMAWRRPGAKPISEPMLVRSPTHICVTRLQGVNISSTCYGHPSDVCTTVHHDTRFHSRLSPPTDWRLSRCTGGTIKAKAKATVINEITDMRLKGILKKNRHYESTWCVVSVQCK